MVLELGNNLQDDLIVSEILDLVVVKEVLKQVNLLFKTLFDYLIFDAGRKVVEKLIVVERIKSCIFVLFLAVFQHFVVVPKRSRVSILCLDDELGIQLLLLGLVLFQTIEK